MNQKKIKLLDENIYKLMEKNIALVPKGLEGRYNRLSYLTKTKCKIWAYWHIVIIPNVKNFFYFEQLAFLSLFGKFGIISSREVRSNANFKYLQMEVSYFPVSSKHNYD